MINATKSISRHLNEVLLELEKLKLRVSFLEKENLELREENQRLKAMFDTNSSNSSKPPSTDGFVKIFNSREPTDRKPGGQHGHKGRFRDLFGNPDEIIEYKHKTCECGHEIEYKKYVAKQFVDVEIKVNLTEHRGYIGKCPLCKKKYNNSLPSHLINTVTYSDNVKALAILLSAEGCVAVDRMNRILREISCEKLKVSNGTIINWQNEFAKQTSDELANYKKELLESRVLHKDETSIDVGKELHWLHVLSNQKTTLYHADAKRGHAADKVMGVLPLYKNVLVHDHLASLVNLPLCEHQECNAHILRYLKGAKELRKRKFAESMIELLVKAHRETLVSGQKKSLPSERISYYEKEYDRILDAGLKESLHHKEDSPLITRMKEYRDWHLLFLSRAEVPFDNNLAERDLRMIKTKAKVSGHFRSRQGSETFAATKSILSTARKRGENLFQKIKSFYTSPVPILNGV